MGRLLDQWNNSKFNVYNSEEKTVLKIIENINNFNGEIAKEVENKTNINGDHKGSWQGLNKPTLSDEGMRATVEKHITDIENINEYLSNIVVDVESLRTEDDTDDTLIQRVITLIPNGGVLLLSKDEYNLYLPITLAPTKGDENYTPNTKYKIYSNQKVVINYQGGGTFLQLGKRDWGTTNLSTGYIDVELQNLRIRHLGTYTNSLGIDVLNVRKIKFKNIEVRGFETGIHTLNVWNSSNMEEVIIWNADKSTGGIGLHIDRATNNITYKNCAVLGLGIGVLIRAVDSLTNVGNIYTNLFTNLDVEYCNFGILLDGQKCNISNVKIDTSHFENNDYHIVTYHTNTIWNFKVDNCFFLGGDINIASKTNGEDDATFGKSYIYGGGIFNSFINNGKIRINSDNIITLVNFQTKGNNFYGSYLDKNGVQQNTSIVTNTLSTNQSQALMTRYSNQPITPTRYDDVGDYGDIKWDTENLYLRTQSAWKMIPLTKRISITPNEKIKITGQFSVPLTQLEAWGFKDIQITVQGVNFDSGWVVKCTPRKWLENGVNYNSWISGENNLTLRIFASGTSTTVQPQEWYYIIERISE